MQVAVDQQSTSSTSTSSASSALPSEANNAMVAVSVAAAGAEPQAAARFVVCCVTVCISMYCIYNSLLASC